MTCVLICDDDTATAGLFAIVVEKAGGIAFLESNPIDAVNIYVNDRRVTVALVDYNLEGAMNGVEVLSAFQEIRPDVRRILITANARDAAIVDALQSGAVEVLLEKPPRLADLRAALGVTSARRGSSSRP